MFNIRLPRRLRKKLLHEVEMRKLLDVAPATLTAVLLDLIDTLPEPCLPDHPDTT
jgi:hypothetical protein